MLSRGASVRAELRGAVDLATTWQGEGAPPDPVRHSRPRRRDLELRHPIPILRANVNLRSSAFRHALRLAVTVGIAAAIDRASGLPRGYWIPLTVLFVLRPDFGATFTRGLQRYVGTALGVVLATLITAALHPGSFVLAALITALSFCFCALLFANYGLFTLSITACIIFFVSYAGPHNEYATALDRLLDTTIGATLTLGIYALWPTWERALLPDTTAELIEADRAYVSALLQAWLDPASHTREEVASARAAARLARTNTAASVQRALLEPPAATRPSAPTRPPASSAARGGSPTGRSRSRPTSKMTHRRRRLRRARSPFNWTRRSTSSPARPASIGLPSRCLHYARPSRHSPLSRGRRARWQRRQTGWSTVP